MSDLSVETPHRATERAVVRLTLAKLSAKAALPALPAAATAALAVARDPDANIDKLCRVIRRDVGLAARVLRVANSASFGRRRPARTLREAVITVGLRETCNVLVAASARQIYDVSSPHATTLWNHALATAVAAEELAMITHRADPTVAFLPALFHDLGLIVFLLADPTAFEVIQQMVETGEEENWQLEREWYGFDHGEAGQLLAESWGLAPDQCDAIAWHHDWQRADSGRDLAALVNAADALAYAIGFGTSFRRPPAAETTQLGLSREDELACMERVREAFAAQAELFAR